MRWHTFRMVSDVWETISNSRNLRPGCICCRQVIQWKCAVRQWVKRFDLFHIEAFIMDMHWQTPFSLIILPVRLTVFIIARMKYIMRIINFDYEGIPSFCIWHDKTEIWISVKKGYAPGRTQLTLKPRLTVHNKRQLTGNYCFFVSS